MKLFMSEHVKVLKVEAGFAIGTFRVPVDILDAVMSLAECSIHAACVIKTRSRVCLAVDASSSPAYAALVISARADIAKKEAAKRQSRRVAAKAGVIS